MKKQRGSLWDQPVLTVVQNHLVRYPTPSNLNGNYNWGVQAGLCLVLQILTGIFLAMHYTAHVDLAFHSVQHQMRDVPNGWLLRYLHANGASLFFIVVYMHQFRALYYTSYAQPREFVWLVGVVILQVMILTAFIGYVLPWGRHLPEMSFPLYACAFFTPRVLAFKRIGPHNYDTICFLYGALLSDRHAEKHGNGTRVSFHHSTKQNSFLYWKQRFLAERGYCTNIPHKPTKIIGKDGLIYYSIKFHTFSFRSFGWLHEAFYENNVKKVPRNVADFQSPLAQAVWIMMDGNYNGYGIRLYCNRFSKRDKNFLREILLLKYGIVTTQSSSIIYIPKRSFTELKRIVEPYFEKSMLYKLGINSQFSEFFFLFCLKKIQKRKRERINTKYCVLYQSHTPCAPKKFIESNIGENGQRFIPFIKTVGGIF